MNAYAIDDYSTISAWDAPRSSRDRRGRVVSLSATDATNVDSADLARAFKALWSLKDLSRDWNSYAADPIAAVALQAAHGILGVSNEIGLLPKEIIPTARGGVQLEWSLPDRELEVEVCADRSVAILLTKGEEASEMRADDVAQITTDFLVRLLHF